MQVKAEKCKLSTKEMLAICHKNCQLSTNKCKSYTKGNARHPPKKVQIIDQKMQLIDQKKCNSSTKSM